MSSSYIRLAEGQELLPFDCGDKDLNEFFFKDALDYQRGLFAVTYYIKGTEDTIVYFSLSNDKLSSVELSKNAWRRIKGSVPHEKHRKDYPAVKIGRFAVSQKFQHLKGVNWGTSTMNYIKQWMVEGNKTGCRFITVDAYKEAVTFYQKNGFIFLGREEEDRYIADKDNPDSEGTYAMYFDLSNLVRQEDLGMIDN